METALENQYVKKLREVRGGGSDSPLQKGPPAIASEALRAGGEEGSEGDAGAAFRKLKMAALKERAKEKIEEKKEQLGGYLKDRLLNFIPFYGPWKVFKAAVTGKFKTKIKLIDVIIMLFSNLEVLFIVLGALAFISLIVSWTLNPLEALKALWSMGTEGISALVSLFSGLLK